MKKMDVTLPGDREIVLKLKERTTPELLAFQKKLIRMSSPQSMAIRFHIIQELLFRDLFGGEDINESS